MDEILVKVEQGIVRGSVAENVEGRKYIVFQGIPYAEPPVGDLRFKDPRPPLPWTGIHYAVKKKDKAAQIDSKTGNIIGEDDCLYLNLATNSLSGKKPVMVWIHGGAFSASSGDLDSFGPDYLLKHDIVFVSINYRLGIFGFLNMEVEECPGNQGLKDQVFALKWVQQNIESFGGDKENVTIFGESAGSASVHYHCISPLTTGLFQKAICQSGVVINPWAFQDRNKDFAFEITSALGKKTSDPIEAVRFLRTVASQKVLETQMKVPFKNSTTINIPFLPTLDTKSSNPFLPRPLADLLKEDIKVPLIIGYNSHEGMRFTETQEEMFKSLNNTFEERVAADLNLSDKSNVPMFAKDIKEFYFKKEPITLKERENLIQYRGDYMFANGIQIIVERQMERKTPTYFYRFSYNAESSLLKRIAANVNIEGADHADENYLLFYRPLLGRERQLKMGTKDYLAMERMSKMWCNFAKTGDPTPKIDEVISTKWSPLLPNKKNYLEINNELLSSEDPSKESWNLWKPILQSTNLKYMMNLMTTLIK
ncbi:esterase FE4-like isoform X2 [Belonocnema kinseyi]|nr:esterase FE4-like isoform X2 [Belonocnema kinseyi]XP_033223063.1 esterase FE4-like isoform X2 [Belonocnema kinseyi]